MAEPKVKMLRIIRNRCAMYAFSSSDTLGFRGCHQYRSPRRVFSLSDPRSLSTKDFIDLMGDWGSYDSLESFRPFQDSLMVEGFPESLTGRFTVESGPIVALEFILAQDFSDVDSLRADYNGGAVGGTCMLKRDRDFFPSGAETYFRIPMTHVGNGADDDKNGFVDDFAELEHFPSGLLQSYNQRLRIFDVTTGKKVFSFGIGIDPISPGINSLSQYFRPNGDSSYLSGFNEFYMHYHPDSGWVSRGLFRGESSLRGGKQGFLVAANLYMSPASKFTEKISVKLYTIDRNNAEVVLNKPIIYRFDPSRHPFGTQQPPADPFNGDMLPGEIYLVDKKSKLQDTKEYQLLLWLPTGDLARVFDGGVPVSDMKGRRYAVIELERPLPEIAPAGEKPNIGVYHHYLFLE